MSPLAQSNVLQLIDNTSELKCLQIYYEEKQQILWLHMDVPGRQVFTWDLLRETDEICDKIAKPQENLEWHKFKYVVWGSAKDNIFNLGGDLDLFQQLIAAKNREGLTAYARACINPLYKKFINSGRSDITSISLVQGKALGGGLEMALSSDVVIAERGAQMGFPEIMFSLFPGMGAYSVLSRKVGPVQAERMMTSGELYTAEQLYEMGLVDVLAEVYQGEMAVYEQVRKEERSRNGIFGVRAAKNLVNPIRYEELWSIAEIWVERALQLTERDLRMMSRLVSRQMAKAS